MKTTSPEPEMPISVGFVSLGCAKNLVDSQVMAGSLIREGMVLARSPEEAEVIIVNTCAFIEEAREESVANILDVCTRKKKGPCRAVLVAGCLSQRYGEQLLESLPEVDAFIGLDVVEDVGEIIRRVIREGGRTCEISTTARRLFEPTMPGLVFTGGPYAYVKIAEGCNHRCAFCAIPSIRGAYRSRPIRRIVEEARPLLEQGIGELNLISQDLMSYGRDLKDEAGRADLPQLLRALGKLADRFWIRLLYGYVSEVSDDLLKAMAEVSQVRHYLDIPIQHSHPEILRAMNRGRTADKLKDTITRARSVLPDVTLRTTCLVGFPGETDDHLGNLQEFITWAEFDHLGVFVYSPEEGTAAYDLPGRPTRETAEQRREQLLTVQKKIVDQKAASLVGTTDTFMLETPVPDEPDTWMARASRQAPEVDGQTLVEGVPGKRKAGEFIRARYTGQAEYDMVAAV